MKPWLAKLFAFLAVLGIFGLIVSFGSKRLDLLIVGMAWAYFVVASIIAMVKTRRAKGPDGTPSAYPNQLSALPRSWQRWILGEKK